MSEDPAVKKALQIEGMMKPEELEWIAHQARYKDFVLEIGVLRGRTTTALCEACPGVVISVDPLDFTLYEKRKVGLNPMMVGAATQFFTNTKEYRESGKLRFIRESSQSPEALEQIRKVLGPNGWVGFAFIDGNHGTIACGEDIYNCASFMAPHTVLAGHDKGRVAVDRALKECCSGYHTAKGSIWVTRPNLLKGSKQSFVRRMEELGVPYNEE